MDLWTLTFTGFLGLFFQQPGVSYSAGQLVGATPNFYVGSVTPTGSIENAQCSAENTISVTGANTGDICLIGQGSPSILRGGLPFGNVGAACYVSSANTVQSRFCAPNTMGYSPPSPGSTTTPAICTTSPCVATVELGALQGGTGIVAVGFDGTVAGDSVTGITDNGTVSSTWTSCVTKNAAAAARVEIWTTGSTGIVSSNATSVSVSFTGTITDVFVIGAATTLKEPAAICANAVTAIGTTATTATASLTTTQWNSTVIAAVSAVGTSPAQTALTGNEFSTENNTVGSLYLGYNGPASPPGTPAATVNATTITTPTHWAEAVVELPMPPVTITGYSPSTNFAVLDGTTNKVSYIGNALEGATAAVEYTGTITGLNTSIGSLNEGTCSSSLNKSVTVTVTGAAVGDICVVGPPSTGFGTDISATCAVSSANTVEIDFCNWSATALETPKTGTWTFKVFHSAPGAPVSYASNTLQEATAPVIISATTTFSGTVAASSCVDQTALTGVTGAAVGNPCVVGPPSGGFGTNLTAYCYVNATNDITPRFCNTNTTAETKETGTWTFGVVQ